MLNRDDIIAYIQTLRKPLENRAITQANSEREKKRQWLWNMIENAASDSDKLRAMDLLNKMDAEYININKNIDDNKTDISNLDTDKLIQLAGIN